MRDQILQALADAGINPGGVALLARVDLRKHARGKPCMIRLPGCDGGGETTVLCHYRMQPYCGAGIKPPDFSFGAWGCASCHALVDGVTQPPPNSKLAIRLAHAEACLRTIEELRKEGVIGGTP